MTNTIPFPFELKTDRLTIRPPSEADAPELLQAISETIDALKPWMPWAKPGMTIDEAYENCRNAEAAFEAGSDHRLHLLLRDSSTLIGASGLHRIDWTVPKCEIGYWVRAGHGQRGYITEAVRAIARFALSDLGMCRVEIRMSTTNLRSRKVPERLGFKLEGILRNEARELDGTLRDTCVFSMLKGEQDDLETPAVFPTASGRA